MATKMVEAVLWNGSGFQDGPPKWLLDAIQRRGTPDKEVGAAMRMRDHVHIGTPVGIMIAQPEDYIVLMDDGSIWPMTSYEYSMNMSFAAPIDFTGLDAALDELRKPVDEVRE